MNQNPETALFQCQRCGNCCRWSGEVPVGDEEIEAIAAFLGLSLNDCIAQFATLRRDRAGLALIEKPDGACIFLDRGNRCLIEDVKPEQCRGFPNAWRFPGWREVCEAIPVADKGDPAPGRWPCSPTKW